MEFIDTHCHLNDAHVAWPPAEALKQAQAKQVVQLVVPGVDIESSHRAVQLAQEFPGAIFAAVGVHPHDVLAEDFDPEQAVGSLRQLVHQDHVVAIGEIGIDYHHYTRPDTGARQREAFLQQLALAIELELPVIVHGRDAYDDVLDVIKDFPGSRGVLHSFEAPYEVAKTALDQGWLVSFTALVTYPKYEWLRDVVQRLPLDRIMLETDAPYLPPQRLRNASNSASGEGIGSRGRNNEPANVVDVAEAVAAINQRSVEDVAEITTTTARRFFNLPLVS